jgi:hypothetical protein
MKEHERSHGVASNRNAQDCIDFISETQLNRKAIALINNGDSIGLYYTAQGNIRILDIWNESHKATK